MKGIYNLSIGTNLRPLALGASAHRSGTNAPMIVALHPCQSQPKPGTANRCYEIPSEADFKDF